MAPHGNRRATVVARVGFGVAELRPDPARDQAWTLLIDGVPQSYVDLADPAHVGFDYLDRLALVLRRCAPAGVPLRILHLGGGGLTLPRLVSATRPGSAQTVVERDRELVTLVSRVLPPPAGVRIVVGDARDQVESSAGAGYDVIVADVFAGARMPDSVATTGFAAAAGRALRAGGLLAMNLTDLPPLAHTRIQVATLRSVFADVGLLADPAVLRGRKAGNTVLVAGDALAGLPARIGALHGAPLNQFSSGAKARLDEPG